jgi:hypothetical protein
MWEIRPTLAAINAALEESNDCTLATTRNVIWS